MSYEIVYQGLVAPKFHCGSLYIPSESFEGIFDVDINFNLQYFFAQERWEISSTFKTISVDAVVCSPKELANILTCPEIQFTYQRMGCNKDYLIIQNNTSDLWVFNDTFNLYFKETELLPNSEIKVLCNYNAVMNIYFNNRYLHVTTLESSCFTTTLKQQPLYYKNLQFQIEYRNKLLQQSEINKNARLDLRLLLKQHSNKWRITKYSVEDKIDF